MTITHKIYAPTAVSMTDLRRAKIADIVSACKNRKQTLLFSATMSNEAKTLVDEFLGEHEIIDINANQPKKVIEEFFCDIRSDLKLPFLKFLIKTEKIRAGLIFSNTKEGAKKLFDQLKEGKYKVELIEGEMSTHARKKALDRLKRKLEILLQRMHRHYRKS